MLKFTRCLGDPSLIRDAASHFWLSTGEHSTQPNVDIILVALCVGLPLWCPETWADFAAYGRQAAWMSALCLVLSVRTIWLLGTRGAHLTRCASDYFLALAVISLIARHMAGRTSSVLDYAVVNTFVVLPAVMYTHVRVSYSNVCKRGILLVVMCSLFGGAVALITCVSWLSHGSVRQVFLNPNHLALYLMLLLPFQLLAAWQQARKPNQQPWRAHASACVLLGCGVLTVWTIVQAQCRMAIVGMCALIVLSALVAGKEVLSARRVFPKVFRQRFYYIIPILVVAALCASLIILCKPLSSLGRVSIARISWDVLRGDIWWGTGVVGFAPRFSALQAEHFARVESVPLRMAAGYVLHPFCQYTHALCAMGAAFAWPLLVFYVICLVGALACVARRIAPSGRTDAARECAHSPSRFATNGKYLLILGAACAVLLHLFAGLTHTTMTALSLSSVFMVCAAFVASARGASCVIVPSGPMIWSLARASANPALLVTGLVPCAAVAMWLPLQVSAYKMRYIWHRAHVSQVHGDYPNAAKLYGSIWPAVCDDGRCCADYASVLAAMARHGISVNFARGMPGSASTLRDMWIRVVELSERALPSYPDPDAYENLAVAYLQLAQGTSFPVRVQTRYRMETPAQTIARKVREWRCGTNLFFEPPPDELSQSECIGRAIEYLTLASNILPWRLTSRWYLAQVYRDVGDYSNAVKYTQLVVNIPMKKDTPRAREIKVNAQQLLNELGVQCDDPGLVVFDIRDRRTWNEGRW